MIGEMAGSFFAPLLQEQCGDKALFVEALAWVHFD
jgi:hypothetical protein